MGGDCLRLVTRRRGQGDRDHSRGRLCHMQSRVARQRTCRGSGHSRGRLCHNRPQPRAAVPHAEQLPCSGSGVPRSTFHPGLWPGWSRPGSHALTDVAIIVTVLRTSGTGMTCGGWPLSAMSFGRPPHPHVIPTTNCPQPSLVIPTTATPACHSDDQLLQLGGGIPPE